MDDEHLLFGITPEEWAQTPASMRTGFLTLVDMVKQLSGRVKTLEAQVKQTSRNSSKPSSSDPPSAPPPAARVPRGQQRGAQKGHPDQQRPLVPPDEVDEVVELRPTLCPSCPSERADDLPLAEPTFCSQVWELPPLKAIESEYQQHRVVCPCCKLLVTAELPQAIPPGAFGPRLSALAALLHGSYRLSIRETVRFLNEVCAVALCSGSVIASCQRFSQAREPIYDPTRQRVQDQPRVWVDATSWREQNKQVWLWVAESQGATLFRSDTSRAQKARKRLLGERFDGIVHSDRAKA